MKKPSGAQTDGSAQNLVDVAAVDQLAKIVSQYDLSEIEMSLGDLQVRLARQRAPSAADERSCNSPSGARRGQSRAELCDRSRCNGVRLRPIWQAP